MKIKNLKKEFKNIAKSAIVFTFILILSFALTSCGIKKDEPTTTAVPTVKVTFPEGYTVLQISELLEKNKVCSAEDFQNLCRTVPENYKTLIGEPRTTNVIFPLEGYLFPDTYEFYVGESAQSVLERFLSNTKSKLTEEHFKRAEELGMTMNEVITFASVIQSEAGVNSEMADVSAVFHNRLERQASGFPYIGSDVTRHYIEKKMKPYIEENELDYNALFADYCTNDGYDKKTQGLPKGPICNPGLSAINATLNPSDADYLYFFTDPDGGFHYNHSLSKHQTEYYKAYH